MKKQPIETINEQLTFWKAELMDAKARYDLAAERIAELIDQKQLRVVTSEPTQLYNWMDDGGFIA